MATILTVDDSRAIRALVAKQAQSMGLSVEEAENGEDGLSRLSDIKFDLVVLDVTMPVLDGPGMLKKMRERGDQTPVLMLTSEAKKSIIAEVMSLGIADYIMKPFEPHELLQKMQRALKIPGAASAVQAVEAPRPVASAEPAASNAKQFVDVMVIDDMDNVHKRVRQMLPEHITLNTSTSANGAITLCRDRVYRLLLLDNDIPDVNTGTLLGQLRLLQPSAACVALALKSGNDLAALRSIGFDDVLFKPFDQSAVDDILARYFDKTELLQQHDNLIRVSKFTGKADKSATYFDKVTSGAAPLLEKIAAGCFEDAVLDLSLVPDDPELVPRAVVKVSNAAAGLGISLKVVANEVNRAGLLQFVETSSLPLFASVDAAKSVG